MATEKDDLEREDSPEEEEQDKKAVGKDPEERDGHDDEIDVSEPESDEKDTRAARRGRRYSELEERLRQSDERAARFEAELSAARARLDADAAAARARENQGPEKDEYEDRINGLVQARLGKLAQIRSAGADDAAVRKLAEESLGLEAQIADLRAERIFAKQQKKTAQAQPAQQDGSFERRLLESEFPGVYQNQQVFKFAHGRYLQLTSAGEPDGIETARRANREALVQFGLARGNPAPASRTQQMRYSGNQNGSGPTQPTGKVKLSGSLRKIARARAAAMGKDEDDAVSEKKFAKRLREKEIL